MASTYIKGVCGEHGAHSNGVLQRWGVRSNYWLLFLPLGLHGGSVPAAGLPKRLLGAGDVRHTRSGMYTQESWLEYAPPTRSAGTKRADLTTRRSSVCRMVSSVATVYTRVLRLSSSVRVFASWKDVDFASGEADARPRKEDRHTRMLLSARRPCSPPVFSGKPPSKGG